MYWLISCSRAARSPLSWYRRRSSRSPRSGIVTHRNVLRQLDPLCAVPLRHSHVVDDGFEDPAQPEPGLVRAAEVVGEAAAERPDARVNGTAVETQRQRHVCAGVAPLEERIDGRLDVVQHVVRQIETRRETAEDEVRYRAIVPSPRKLERYDVGHCVLPASRSSSSNSCSRSRAAAAAAAFA